MRDNAGSSKPRLGLSHRARITAIVVAALVAAATMAVMPRQGAAPAAMRASAQSATATTYYISLGDSYAAGNQPIPSANAGTDTNGFAYQVVALAAAKGHHFTLENFACPGATTATVLDQRGCSIAAPGPDSTSYRAMTQAAAAEQFISEHPGEIGLITVSIGGNDLLACSAPQIVIACATGVAKVTAKNLAVLLAGLRRAAGPGVPIVSTTYPDIFLGLYRSTSASLKRLATLSLTEFRSIFNPALRASYLAVGARFVDVTAATGAYTPFAETTSDPPYGTVPVAVADVCTLTYYCQLQDVHPKRAGYTVIAQLIVATLTKRP